MKAEDQDSIAVHGINVVKLLAFFLRDYIISIVSSRLL